MLRRVYILLALLLPLALSAQEKSKKHWLRDGVDIPDVMRPYVDHFDFVLGPQSSAPYNAGMITYDGTARLNIIRNIREPRLERALYEVLRSRGVKVKVESNYRTPPTNNNEKEV